ncbi:MAG: primosomal protein N' [Defluviitaleaceae bacterium]|nr:primosomal protein N' [Defluviitaleaceae bacterium]
MDYVEVVIPINHKKIDKTFIYSIPDKYKDKIKIGMAVTVPFGTGNKMFESYVVGFPSNVNFKTKDIENIVKEDTYISQNMILLAMWMKTKYYTTLNSCLKAILPPSIVKSNDKKTIFIKIVENQENNINEIIKKETKQSNILKYLLENGDTKQNILIKTLGISISPINSLKKLGLINTYSKTENRNPVRNKDEKQKNFILNEEQAKAFSDVMLYHKSNIKNKKPILIHGVTGSGKTEVYMEIISEVLKEGKEAIVLVPEISLTPQTLSRFISKFGDLVNFTHSKLSNGERYDQWKNAKNGDISIMIGPRSAIFTPFNNLGIIIIDEEHEQTYKSELAPKFDTREVAIQRSKFEGATVIFGTASPSIDTYFKTKQKEYKYIQLKKRVNNNPPEINVIDMRLELKLGNISIFCKDLQDAISENLEKKMQTILFLNRRGHSTFVSCRNCGHVMSCEACNVNYTYHKYNDKLVCHYCNKEEENPKHCPTCASKFIKYFGIGTQRVEKEIKEKYPEAKILRMDLDTTTAKHSHEDILNKFRNKEADILIGTQMIAKGLDFPNVTLVGIIAADTSLNVGDYRSSEVTFQLLTQVSGRAGRSENKGYVYIQTYNPDHYSIMYAKNHDYDGFYKQEISFRKSMFYPPFSNIFMILFTSENEKDIITSLFKLKDIMEYYIRKRPIFEVLGPSPAVISKIQNKYRWKIIVKSKDEEPLVNFVLYTLAKLEKQHNINNININITLNPMLMV